MDAVQITAIIMIFGFVCFTFVLIFRGAPFLPTLKKQVPAALDLLGLEPGQTLLELGSGDGRVLKAAAERGIKSVGIELNPLLVIWSRILTWRYRRLIRIKWGNIWTMQWPPADGIFVFLLQPYMETFDKAVLKKARKPVKVVSFAFFINSRKPLKQRSGLYLYSYE